MNPLLTNFWQGKSVLITGASSGLGWAVAEALAPLGVQLGLLARSAEKLQELASQLRDRGSSCWWQKCDIRNREAVRAAVQAFSQHTGRLDVAWINSGIGSDSSYEFWKWDTMENQIDTNIKGSIYTTLACLEVMAPQRAGSIVGIGSVASMRGLPRRGIYSMTKIAVAWFWESMATELPEIDFTIIHPGYVDTAINRGNPNRFFLMQPEQAAQMMITAVAKRKPVYIYPWQMRLLYRVARFVPAGLFRRLGHRFMDLSRPKPQKVS